MTLSERVQVERFELGDARNDAALRPKGQLAVPVLSVVLVATAAVLIWQTAELFAGWDHAIVLAGIVTTTVGLMIAISPQRRSG
jgi:hypothetical protein